MIICIVNIIIILSILIVKLIFYTNNIVVNVNKNEYTDLRGNIDINPPKNIYM